MKQSTKLHKRYGTEHHEYCRHCGEYLDKNVIGHDAGLCSDCYTVSYYYYSGNRE